MWDWYKQQCTFKSLAITDSGHFSACTYDEELQVYDNAGHTIAITGFIVMVRADDEVNETILEKGTLDGQVVIVINESTKKANVISFNPDVAVSNVLTDSDGDVQTINASSGAMFVWLARLGAWIKVS